MDFKNNRLTVKKAKEIDMVDYLSTLGHEPAKTRNNDYWYLSPLRDEKTPSFKINRRLNRWYDHGTGKGGNLIDFAIAFHHCTIGELLDKLTLNYSFQQPENPFIETKDNQGNKIKLVKEFTLSSNSLLRYLKQRRIPLEIAEKYCREIRYEINYKIFYAIGFKNDSGGFELRNPYFKGSLSPKNISTIHNNAEDVVVLEGFMDFLSFKTIHQNMPEDKFDFVILNSLSFFQKARPFMENHKTIKLFLDRDKAGQNCSIHALSISQKYQDESNLYKNNKDLNEWMVHFGHSNKMHLRQRIQQ